VLQSDPDYCRYLRSVIEAERNSTLAAFGVWLSDQEIPSPPQMPAGSSVLRFGDHRGKTYEEVLQLDPEYCRFVLGVVGDDRNSPLAVFGLWLRSQEIPSSPQMPVGSTVLHFGQHKGMTYEEVLHSDPKYCRYMLGDCDVGGNSPMAAFIGWLRDQEIPSSSRMPAGSSVLRVGIHKGKTYEEVLLSDAEYCRYMLGEIDVDGNSGLAAFLEWLRDQEIPSSPQMPVASSILRFGQHKGKTYEEVLQSDPDYCRYMLGDIEADCNSPRAAFIEWLHDQPIPSSPQMPMPAGSSVLLLGHYYGKTYEEVLQLDPEYCRYMLDEIQADRNSPMAAFGVWLRDQEMPSSPQMPAGSSVLRFGDHRGKTYEKVLHLDPEYCRHMLGEIQADRNSPLAAFGVWLHGQEIPSSSQIPESSSVLHFGKYKGKTYEEVLQSDPNYCYAMLWDIQADGNLPGAAFIEWLRDQETLSSLQLRFGKHSGKTYEEVLQTAPVYCQWVMLRDFSNCTSLVKFAEWLEIQDLSDYVQSGSSILEFGMHEDKSYEDVLQTYPDYCRNMRDTAFEAGKTPKMMAFAEWLTHQELPAAGSSDSGQPASRTETSFEKAKPSTTEGLPRSEPRAGASMRRTSMRRRDVI